MNGIGALLPDSPADVEEKRPLGAKEEQGADAKRFSGPPGAISSAGSNGQISIDVKRQIDLSGLDPPPPSPPGPPGDAGEKGQKGEKGNTGQKGEKGAKGELGQAGAQGPKGPPGAPGSLGPTGQNGIPGKQGEPGLEGPRGLPGDCRPVVGYPGPPGLPGPAGPPGRVIYGPREQEEPELPPIGAKRVGVVFTRWGRTSCPDTDGTESVYKGRVAGSSPYQQGGTSDYLCLSGPEYDATSTPQRRHTEEQPTLVGTEYATFEKEPLYEVGGEIVPCVTCRTYRRNALLVIPARVTCPESWTTEYSGFLLSSASGSSGPTSTVCVDRNPDWICSEEDRSRSAKLYHMEAEIEVVDTPTNYTERELPCVVCTK